MKLRDAVLPAVMLLSFLAKPALASDADCAYDPERTRLSRVVAIDSTGGPVYGSTPAQTEGRTRQPLVLNDHEVVLTFEGGPHGAYTQYILNILNKHCVKAVFFFNGKSAISHPQLVREVARHGHTVAAQTWSDPTQFDKIPAGAMNTEIEKGLFAVNRALGAPVAPFFRFPRGQASPGAIAYLSERNISAWYADFASGDGEGGIGATKLANQAIARVQAAGRGIIQFHDTKKVTVDALDSILHGLKQGGFKIVHLVPSTFYVPNAELVSNESLAGTLSDSRPVSRHLVVSAKKRAGHGRIPVRESGSNE